MTTTLLHRNSTYATTILVTLGRTGCSAYTLRQIYCSTSIRPIETTLVESPAPLAVMTHMQVPTPLLTTIGAPYTKYINPARFVSLSPQELVVVLC